MSRTLLDLANRMDKLAAAIPKQTNELAKKVVTTIVTDLAYHTPVDTSAALSNWVVTKSRKYGGRLPPHFPGELGSTRNASAQETIAAAKIAIEDKKPGQKIFITNNIPYIVDLNNGSSRQAPAGFVERAALIGRKVILNYRFRL